VIYLSAFLVEPLFYFGYLASSTYLFLYTFIVDDFPKFVVSLLLINPFIQWFWTLVRSIEITYLTIFSDGMWYLVQVITTGMLVPFY
jgi:hypothetical protein